MAVELFQADPVMVKKLPPLPVRKAEAKDRFDIPSDIRPVFSEFAVQFLCWGVRDLPRIKV